jgi:hypothetical protein
MAGASDLERFLGFARAFELAFVADTWAALEPWLHEDARHLVHSEPPLAADDRGRAAAIAGLRASVHGMDRRFDVRIPEVIAGPLVRPGGIWMRFSLRLRRAGLPELAIEGDHLAVYDGGRIVRIEETIDPETGERAAAFLAEHDAALRPAGAPVAAPADPRDLRELEAATMRTLARAYGGAKSARDLGAALGLCSDDFVLETPSLGTTARGRKQAERQLGLFFAAFPDYRVELDGLATGPDTVACWGTARMSWRGPFGPHAPSGRAAALPFTSVFPCAGGSLRGERFLFDLASLCEQIGLPLDAARATLAAVRAAEELA